MKPFDESDPTPERPMYDPATIPGSEPYPKRHPISGLDPNPAVRSFLAGAIRDVFDESRDCYELLAERHGRTFEEEAADSLLCRLSHQFPGVRGLLVDDDERVKPKLENLGIGPHIGPIPPGLQLPVVSLAIASTYIHRLLVELLEGTKLQGVDIRATMTEHDRLTLESSEKALEQWRDHLGMGVYEALQDVDV